VKNPLWTSDDGTLYPSLHLCCFSKINSEIFLNKFSKQLFTSLPFLRRNLFLVITFSTRSPSS
jgi:hypothetical protein